MQDSDHTQWFQLNVSFADLTVDLDTVSLVLTELRSDSYEMENEFSDADGSAIVPHKTHSDKYSWNSRFAVIYFIFLQDPDDFPPRCSLVPESNAKQLLFVSCLDRNSASSRLRLKMFREMF